MLVHFIWNVHCFSGWLTTDVLYLPKLVIYQLHRRNSEVIYTIRFWLNQKLLFRMLSIMVLKASTITISNNSDRWSLQIASSKYVLWIDIPPKSSFGRQRNRARARERTLYYSKGFTWVVECYTVISVRFKIYQKAYLSYFQFTMTTFYWYTTRIQSNKWVIKYIARYLFVDRGYQTCY